MTEDTHERASILARLHELEGRVARMEDVEDIKRLQARYAAVCDNRYNPDDMVRLFTEDGVWDGGETLGRVEGRDALHRHFAAAGSQFKWAVHFMMAPDIAVAEDRQSARASWYLLEPCTVHTDGVDQQYWLGTVYDISYRNGSQGWQFQQMNLRLLMWAEFAAGWGLDGFGAGPLSSA